MVTIICVLFLIACCFAFYGWGLFLHRLTGFRVGNPFVTITFGLGVVIYFGGVLNLLRFAYGLAFDGLLFSGIVLVFVFNKLKPELPRDKSTWSHVIVLGLLIAVIMGFTVATQLPPRVFNFWDDFEKYFAHPVRMLQTGTLFGSPLSAIGYETLGGQAVLHGIILNHFPIPYINGADAVIGLFLCLTLSVGMIPLKVSFLPVSIICLLVVFFINPQYINISSLYIASALMMTSILLFSNIHHNEEKSHLPLNGRSNARESKPIRVDKNEEKADLPPPVLLGLMYATLTAVKSIYLFFPMLHLSLLIITIKLSGMDTRRLTRWTVNTACWALLFISPWILLHLPHYILTSPFQTTPYATDISIPYPSLLSSRPLLYGATTADYTFVSAAIATAVFAFALWSYREQIQPRRVALACLAASGAAIVVAYPLLFSISSLLYDYVHGLRYAIPFLIAGVPLIFPLDYLCSLKEKSSRFKLGISTSALLLGVFILVCFSQSTKDRIHQSYQSGSMLATLRAFSIHEHTNYSEEVLYGDDTKLRIAAAQKQIPDGEAVVACIMTPFYLDYKRNVIFDAEKAGIGSPWAYIPDVNYFMLEYRGFAVLSPRWFNDHAQVHARHEQFTYKRSYVFLESLVEISQTADMLYDDGKIVVFKKRLQ